MLYYINTKNEQVTVIADNNNTTCIMSDQVNWCFRAKLPDQLKDAELYFVNTLL